MMGGSFLLHRGQDSPSFSVPVLLCCLLLEWKIEWNRNYFQSTDVVQTDTSEVKRVRHAARRKSTSGVKRCFLVAIAGLIFGAMFSSAIYHHLQVTYDGRHVKIKDVLNDFWQSEAYRDLIQGLNALMREMVSFYMKHGLRGIWDQLWRILDFEKDRRAFQVELIECDVEIVANCFLDSQSGH
jgi:hypothetical protein